jgi:hypothetical protein
MTTPFLALALILSGSVAYCLVMLVGVHRINKPEDWE